jgi:hypothetical protein
MSGKKPEENIQLRERYWRMKMWEATAQEQYKVHCRRRI